MLELGQRPGFFCDEVQSAFFGAKVSRGRPAGVHVHSWIFLSVTSREPQDEARQGIGTDTATRATKQA